MKHKYRDILIQNLAIVIGGVITGLGIRLIMLQKGADEFTANSIFWVINFVVILLYLSFVSFGISLIELYKRLKNKKIADKSFNQCDAKKQEADPKNIQIVYSIENLELNEESLQNSPTIIEKETTSEFENEISDALFENGKRIEISDIEKIRIQAKSENEKLLQEKLNFIVFYTKEKFAPYVSDEEINRFCNYLINFLKDSKIENVTPIKVAVLGTIDLMHLGWNVWNHYKGNNQRKDVAKFLKIVFSNSFKEMEESTIEKLLTSRKEQGIIKYEKNLLQ